MKLRTYFLYASLACISFSSVHASLKKEKIFEKNLYKGKEVTPKNLYELAPKPPVEVQKNLKKFFTENEDAWEVLVQQRGPFFTFWKKLQRAKTWLQRKKLNDLSQHNFVFPLPNEPDWMVKISGPVNRASLQVSNQDLPGHRAGETDTKNLLPKTYQTASRISYDLQSQSEIERKQFTKVRVEKNYLWSPNESCADEECVVVQRLLKNIELLGKLEPERLAEVFTKKTIVQVLAVAKHAGLWNITKDNLAVDTQGTVIFLDTEQPNTTKVSQMFNRDAGRWGHNFMLGVKTLYQAMPEGSEQCEWIEMWARKDKDLPNVYSKNELFALFEKNKKQSDDTIFKFISFF